MLQLTRDKHKIFVSELKIKVKDQLQNIVEKVCYTDFSQSQAFAWTSPMVGAWLCIIGLANYLDKFLDNGVDGITLLNLRRSQFQRCLGILNENHSNSLELGLKLLRLRRIDYSHWEWSCDGIESWLNQRALGTVSKVFKEQAVHGGVLFTFTKTTLGQFLSRLPSFDVEVFLRLVFKSLWLSIKRASKTGTSQLFPEKFVEDWGEAEIQTWLNTLNLGHLFQKFKNHGVNGSSLVKLSRRDLNQTIGTSELQTKVILRHVRFLRNYVQHENQNAEELLARNGGKSPSREKSASKDFANRVATNFSSTTDSDSVSET